MDFFQLWDQILEYIDQHDHQYYQMFSYEVFPLSMSDTTLTISPKRPYLVRWIENVYKDNLEKIIFDLSGKHISVEIVPPMSQPSMPQKPQPAPAPMPPAPSDPFPGLPEEEPTPLPEDEMPPLPKPMTASEEAAPFPADIVLPDVHQLKPKTASEVKLPTMEDLPNLQETSLFDTMPKGEEIKKKDAFQPNPINEEYTFETLPLSL